MHHNTKPVAIRGEWYSSCTSAANALGVTIPAILKAKKLGKLDSVGLGPLAGKPRGTGSPITIRGVTYQNRKEASEALGVGVSAIYQAIRRNDIDSIGCGRKGNKSAAKHVIANGVEYSSMTKASKALGVTAGEIRGAIRFNAPGFYFAT